MKLNARFAAISLFVIGIWMTAPLAARAQERNPAPKNDQIANPQDDELKILALVNRQRQRSHVGELKWNEQIAEVARSYSERMAKEGFFGHFDSRGKTATDRAAKVHGWGYIGENLFTCEHVDDLPDFAIRGWLGSETHRTNMLDPQWTSSGVGIAEAANGDLYITELFARK